MKERPEDRPGKISLSNFNLITDEQGRQVKAQLTSSKQFAHKQMYLINFPYTPVIKAGERGKASRVVSTILGVCAATKTVFAKTVLQSD